LKIENVNHYLDFHICDSAAAAFFAEESSTLVPTDFEISSALDVEKLKITDERNESVAVLDTLPTVLFDL
jgi:hypothetical protein